MFNGRLDGFLMVGVPLVFSMALTIWYVYRFFKQAGTQKNRSVQAAALGVERPTVKLDETECDPRLKAILQDASHFLQSPKMAGPSDATPERSLLLTGLNTAGVPIVVQGLAGQAKVPLLRLQIADWLVPGIDPESVHKQMQWVQRQAPAIVLIEGFESLELPHTPQPAGDEQVLVQLLTDLKRLTENRVFVIGLSVEFNHLPASLVGFFSRKSALDLPKHRQREAILRICTRSMSLGLDVNLGLLASTTTGLRDADLANLCRRAAFNASLKSREQVQMVDFEAALERILVDVPSAFLMSDELRRMVVYHAAGHALVAWLVPGSQPLSEVSILPASWNGPACALHAPLESGVRSRSELLADLAVLLAGRAAEEVTLGEATNLAESDLQQATRLARQIVLHWGMGSIGPVVLEADEHASAGSESSFQRWSEGTLALADQEVRQLLEEYHHAACNLLIANRNQLDRLAEVIMREETIDREMINRVLGARQWDEQAKEMLTPGVIVNNNLSEPG